MKIHKRDYSDAFDRIKGSEKIGPERIEKIEECELTLFIVALDESEYMINTDGNPEMTEASQGEYDSFIVQLRESMIRDEIRILDEGYGTGEDELEWHITGGFIKADSDDIVAIIEVQTCVRSDDHDE
ncbi:MAG: hypothetical protein K5669_01305 [Lachnospiraceae bacterium]|nr:hypothetical protein [Lachnospiraceae bacterium]